MDKFSNSIETLVAEWLQRLTGKDSDILTKLMVTVLIFFVLWLVRRLILKALHNFYFRRNNIEAFYHWKNGLNYVVYIIGILLVGQTWFANFQSLATYLGLLSAGLAVALQGPITNLAGWGFIFWRKPFEVGDRIEIGDNSGDVIDIRLFQFTIIEIGNWVDADQTTGRIIHIPNLKVFKDPVANYTTGFNYIWNEVPVLITFESNWRKAKKILQDIVEEHANTVSDDAARQLRKAAMRYMIKQHMIEPSVYTDVKDSGVMLTLRYLCASRSRRISSQEIWENILDAFAEHQDIDLAYPTMRIYSNVKEGKEELKPKE